MTQIRLVANRIPGTPSWGHFQLVRVGDDGSQTEIEVQAPGLPTVGRDWVFSDPDLAIDLRLAGSEHGDIIWSGAGDDHISGGAGDDIPAA